MGAGARAGAASLAGAYCPAPQRLAAALHQLEARPIAYDAGGVAERRKGGAGVARGHDNARVFAVKIFAPCGD
jgi:hypothetical protein